MRCGFGSTVQHIRPVRNRHSGAASHSDRRCRHACARSRVAFRGLRFEGSVMSVVALLKYAVAALGVGLWGYGLADQLESSSSTATYLAITALLVAVARL